MSEQMTKDGGFYYRAMLWHYTITYSFLALFIVVIIFAVLNPFWFRDQFMGKCEQWARRFSRWRDRIKARLYLGADPDVWYALKNKE